MPYPDYFNKTTCVKSCPKVTDYTIKRSLDCKTNGLVSSCDNKCPLLDILMGA